jgi:uncharacterized OsmC-like protein
VAGKTVVNGGDMDGKRKKIVIELPRHKCPIYYMLQEWPHFVAMVVPHTYVL